MEKWFEVSVWMRTRKGVTSEMNMDVVCFASLPGGYIRYIYFSNGNRYPMRRNLRPILQM